MRPPPLPLAMLGEGSQAAFRQVLVYAEPMRICDEMTSRGPLRVSAA